MNTPTTPPLGVPEALRSLYVASPEEITLVEVPALPFLMLEGMGARTEPSFQQAGVAIHALSRAIREALGQGSEEPPIEARWQGGATPEALAGSRASWRWTVMALQPAELSRDLLEMVRRRLVERGVDAPIGNVGLAVFREGLCAQALHLGGETGLAMAAARFLSGLAERGYTTSGQHHEIYLGSVGSDGQATIIRRQVTKGKLVTAAPNVPGSENQGAI